MSRDMVILTPNGRRVKIHCSEDTSILQVLEDACAKQGFQPIDYDLKHHNKILDLTTTVRFCNLPNKAMLEMVEAEKKRVETNITIGLIFEDGERKTGNFPPSISLYDMIVSLAPEKLHDLQQPSILYMRQEVSGLAALKEKTLRQFGLITGRAILRLLNKTEAVQANVSRVYRRPQIEDKTEKQSGSSQVSAAFGNGQDGSISPSCPVPDAALPGPSGCIKKDKKATFNDVQLIKHELVKNEPATDKDVESEKREESETDICVKMDVDPTENDIIETTTTSTSGSSVTFRMSQESLERRLKIEDEVTFLGAQKAIVFMQPDEIEDELQDLPDDFYDLTIEEVRKMYHELQQRRLEFENTPLMTSSQRSDVENQSLQRKQNDYKNAVVRIQFPDHMILQGIFKPSKTIEDVMNFIKEHLHCPDKPFVIFTTPLKEPLNPSTTLLEAKFVPCVHMHFKWSDENNGGPYLKEEIYLKRTSSDAASILASKYRAPTRKTIDETTNQPPNTNLKSSTTKQSKVPKWFKK